MNSSFFVTGGTMHADAPSYVERQADKDLYNSLLAGEFCYALSSRQMGKSSLMVRSVRRLRAQGFKVAVLDLTAIGQNLSAEQWYDGLLAKLGQQLHLEEELEAFWRCQQRLGPLQRWTAALEKVVLGNDARRVIIFVDEIDVVRSLPFSTDEFFAAIRECHNRRSHDSQFQRLSFCLMGVAAPTDLIRDPRLTPFNVGRRIELTDFTPEEALPLAQGFSTSPTPVADAIGERIRADDAQARTRADRDAAALLDRVLYWTHGHPYLTQRLCRAVADDATAVRAEDVDRHCEELFLSKTARERDDNLLFVRERMLNSGVDRTALLETYGRMLAGKPVPEDEGNPLLDVLRLSGIARSEEGMLYVRNRIYAQVFNRAWVLAHTPGAELRRQRAAFRRGMLRAGAIGLASLLLLFGLLTYQRPLKQSVRLADGTTLTLAKVGYGRQHRFEPGTFKLAWLTELVPPLRRFINAHAFKQDTANDALVFWLVRRDSEGLYRGMEWWSDYDVLDEHGCSFGRGNLHESFASSSGGWATSSTSPGSSFAARPPMKGQLLTGHAALTSFPRRADSFKLRLFDTNGVIAAEFTLKNPAPRPAPILIPETLPATRKSGDLEVTLTQLTSKRVPWSMRGTNVLDRLMVSPLFHVTEAGRPTVDWHAPENRMVLSDSSENYSHGTDTTLCLYESAWKIRADFFRKTSARFPSNQIWVITNLPMPVAGSSLALNLTNTLEEVRIDLFGLCGSGSFSYVTGAPKPVSAPNIGGGYGSSGNVIFGERPHIGLRLHGVKPDHQISLWIIDDKGRRTVHPGGKVTTGNSEFWFIEMPTDAETIALHLAVQTARRFEFIVRPPEVAKPAASLTPDQ
ncbi:MAG: AAA-like domain-containing protein [Verrucomicrobiota bacterium]